MIISTYTKIYQNEMLTLDKYMRLSNPEIALEVSDWLSEHNTQKFENMNTLQIFVANRWNITDKSAERLLNVLSNNTTKQFEPLLVG
jgi:RNA-splicing ligase RtcB